MLKKLVGDKAFYRRLFALMLPILVQNGITNFVNMLDNVMIGRVGTAEMTGVAVTNQLIFVFNLCIFGAVSGAGIFGAQYYGKGDHQGLKYTFRFKMLFCGLLAVLGITLFILFGEPLLNLYMQGEGGTTDPLVTLGYAKDYLAIMLVGLVPFAFVQCYSSTLRETGNPNLPMVAGLAAVLVNLVFNALLIFGLCGFPKLGVRGAAIATVLSRFVELAIVVFATHLNTKKYPFMKGALRSLYVPAGLALRFFVKGLPLLLNEAFWAMGLAVVNQSYSARGLDAMGAINISQTFWNVFAIAYMAVGSSIGIILGQMLGAGQLKEAKQDSRKMIAFSAAVSVVVGVLYVVLAEFIPLVYNTTDEIRHMATRMMQISAIAMPFDAVVHASYFAMRSGGKMAITVLFDNGFMWGGNVLISFLLSRFTAIPILEMFAIIHAISLLKAAIGIWLVEKGSWVKNITN
ncbi:MAG: MATE family efflux transporter [Clostridia bacterium]|nr:MATE family efflux transporter [Clostridia bacterium]